MRDALPTYLEHLQRTGDHAGAVVAAAEIKASTPWDVVQVAGLLARTTPAVAAQTIGLNARLAIRPVDADDVIATIEQGALYPQLHPRKLKQRQPFDAPVDMARRVVSASRVAVTGTLNRGLDPACGMGAFLVAMHEAGIPEIIGSTSDPLAQRVAQIACPAARVVLAAPLATTETADLVVGSPPFFPPERQDRYLRARMRLRFPWMRYRFDLSVPFAAIAAECARDGGAVGLVLPNAAMLQPHGAPVRRRWVTKHEVVDLSGPHPFPGAALDVMFVVLRAGAGPRPLPLYGVTAAELLKLDNVPLDPNLMPGDVALVEKVRRCSFPLSAFCSVEGGVSSEAPKGGKSRLLFDKPRKGRVPYADAGDFFAGRLKWLKFNTSDMPRGKSSDMFIEPKIVLQRARGRAPVRAAIDWDGVFVGKTCTVVWPKRRVIPLDRVLDLVRSPLVDAVVRIEQGQRRDLVPQSVSTFPVPRAWLDKPHLGLAEAYGLSDEEVERLEAIAGR